MSALPPRNYTAAEATGWRARMRGEPRRSPFTQRKYVRQFNDGWDAADAHLKMAGAH